MAKKTQRPPPSIVYDYLSDGERIVAAPISGLARGTLYCLAAALTAAVAWAAWAEVDQIVIASGKVVTSSSLVVAQPLETAVVRDIPVKVGDRVVAGQPLAVLDAAFTAADVAELRGRRDALSAELARLSAELAGTAYEGAPADEGGTGGDEAGRVQVAVYAGRKEQKAARLAAYAERAEKLRAVSVAARTAQEGLGKRLAVAGEVEQIRSRLFHDSTGSRLSLLAATDERLRIEAELSAARDRAVESDRELSTLLADQAAFLGDLHRETAEAYAKAISELAGVAERLNKAERRNALVTLTAPVDAVVLELAQRSAGAVAREAEPLVTLVPTGVPLEVEADIPSADIGRVRTGDRARVKLEAFPFQRYGVVEGRLRTVAADAYVRKPEEGGGAAFRARIDLDDVRPSGAPAETRISPGMRATAEIVVGSRSVLSYFLYPVIRVMDESIREP